MVWLGRTKLYELIGIILWKMKEQPYVQDLIMLYYAKCVFELMLIYLMEIWGKILYLCEKKDPSWVIPFVFVWNVLLNFFLFFLQDNGFEFADWFCWFCKVYYLVSIFIYLSTLGAYFDFVETNFDEEDKRKLGISNFNMM